MPGHKDMFVGILFFFEEVSSFPERALRTQAIQGIRTLLSKTSSITNPAQFRANLVSLAVRLQQSGNLDKKLCLAKLLPKLAPLLKGYDDNIKTVTICLSCVDHRSLQSPSRGRLSGTEEPCHGRLSKGCPSIQQCT